MEWRGLGCSEILTWHGRPLGWSGRSVYQLRPVFEMHRIVVRPLPAPDEAVPFENVDNLGREGVGRSGARPQPIFGVGRIDVDRRGPGLHARAPRLRHRTAILRA